MMSGARGSGVWQDGGVSGMAGGACMMRSNRVRCRCTRCQERSVRCMKSGVRGLHVVCGDDNRERSP